MILSVNGEDCGLVAGIVMLSILPLSLHASNWSESIELTAEVHSESAFETATGDLQKWDVILNPELRVNLTSNTRLITIARIRIDLGDNLVKQEPREPSRDSISHHVFFGESTDLELRELYLDTYIGNTSLRLGKQQIVWGQADGLRVLDVVNPFDFREFILAEFEDRRIPLWTVNLEIPIGDDWNMQLIWIPDETYNVMPESGSSFAFTSQKFLPLVPPGAQVTLGPLEKPDRFFKDSDAGIRLTAFLGGWDLSLNYLYHYHDQAVPYRQADENGITITPQYERTHLIGSSFSNAFGDFTFRGEVGYSTNRYFVTDDALDADGVYETGELRYVLGLDYTYDADLLLSGQLFQSVLKDHAHGSLREHVENQFTFLVKKDFLNDTLTLEMLTVHSLNDGDGVVQIDVNYQLTTNIELSTGFDLFYGTSDGLFGQFNQRDRLTVGVHIGL